MKAAALIGPRTVEVRDVPEPRQGPYDVLLRPTAVGLCGSDFHLFTGESNYNLDDKGVPIPFDVQPQVLGHEIGAVVEGVGAEVDDLNPGDQVIVDQGLNCHSFRRDPVCEYCATGDSHQCEFFLEHGITGIPGGLAEQLCVPAVNCIRHGGSLDVAEGAMVEPLGCVLHSSDMVGRQAARYRINDPDPDHRVRSILICGAGPAGQLFVQVLRKVLGFEGRILVSDMAKWKRDLIEGWGAETIDPAEQNVGDAVRDATDGRCVEYLIEATGSGPLFRDIPGFIRKQATVLLYGHGHAGVSLEVLNQIQWREPLMVSPIGASGGFDEDGRPTIYRESLELIESGRIDVKTLVTHRYRGLDEVGPALDSAGSEPGYVKGVVVL